MYLLKRKILFQAKLILGLSMLKIRKNFHHFDPNQLMAGVETNSEINRNFRFLRNIKVIVFRVKNDAYKPNFIPQNDS